MVTVVLTDEEAEFLYELLTIEAERTRVLDP